MSVKKPSKAVLVKLPWKIYRVLAHAADEEDRSVSNTVVRAVKLWCRDAGYNDSCPVEPEPIDDTDEE